MKNPFAATLAQQAEFDEVIDVRSPSEYADDHLPGAINHPVLDDAERVRVGTLYKQVSPFEARKVGAALVARNIAQHLEQSFLDKPKNWKPLIYCWRGGQRSGAMTLIFNQVGWAARQLEGGYKSYRRQVLTELDSCPLQLRFQVIAGATGSGKSRLLAALAAQGAQVLDLEGLARHKGSVLGLEPGRQQPSQRWFESQLLQQLRQFDADRPVFVEAESRRIGLLHLPEALMTQMRAAGCWRVEATLEDRVRFLCQDYATLLAAPAVLHEQLSRLTALHGRQTVQQWQQLITAADWPTLARQLIEMHYDPAYQRSSNGNFSGLDNAPRLPLQLDESGLAAAARHILANMPQH